LSPALKALFLDLELSEFISTLPLYNLSGSIVHPAMLPRSECKYPR